MMRLISIILASCGTLFMVLATHSYRNLFKEHREQSYSIGQPGRMSEKVVLGLCCLFVLGSLVMLFDTMRRDVEPTYFFLVLMFMLLSLFIFSTSKAQINVSREFANKNIEIIKTFINAIDMKDEYTSGHSCQVFQIVDLFYEYLPEEYRKKISKPKLLDAALLHDCGKISLSDKLLRKTAMLSAEDWVKIRQHPQKGKRMLDDTCFREISNWVLYHHERVDGTGYYGLAGEEIPLEARILAIADAYSAMCTDRIYRPKRDHDTVIVLMVEATGSQFDPVLMDYFRRIDRQALIALVGCEVQKAAA